MKRIPQYAYALLLVAATTTITSCKKFADTGNPRNVLTGETVFSSAATATAAVTGIYGRMMSSNTSFAGGGSIYSVSLLAGLSADEWQLVMSDPDLEEVNKNAIQPTNAILSNNLWNEVYQYIFTANQIIHNIQDSDNIPQQVRDQLEGEARFIRAFCHFYLVNLFGEIPVVTSTDRNDNVRIQRSSVTQVYEHIERDLEASVTLLSPDYMNDRNQPGTERIRPNQSAAQALLARVYLYRNQYDKAATAATGVIANENYTLAAADDVFLKNSSEAIWQLQPVQPGFNTWEGAYFLQPYAPWLAILQPSLIGAFETGDIRKDKWTVIDSTAAPYAYPNKYRVPYGDVVTEYSMVLRLAEQYLIRAEARIMQDNIAEGIDDINVIRNRAQLTPLETTLTKDQALTALMHERQTELFTEWGHRWFDLKRTGKINATLGALKGADWQTTDALYPIPQDEMDRNPVMTQNEGY